MTRMLGPSVFPTRPVGPAHGGLCDAIPEKLAAVLAARRKNQARYKDRHPLETLSFFGVEPGMTVVEALPGGGWYTKILLPYLGPKGRLVGVDYSNDM